MAVPKPKTSDDRSALFDEEFLKNKLLTARFYGEHLLPTANGLIPTVKAGGSLLEEIDFEA